MKVSEIKEGNEVIEGIRERLTGRYLQKILMIQKLVKLLAKEDSYMDSHMAEEICSYRN